MRGWWWMLLGGCVSADPGSTALQDQLEGWAHDNEVAAARLVVHRCGEPVFDSHVGAAKEGPVVTASSSKWVAAAAILTLVDDGLMQLDAPLATWLPELGPRPGSATLRQALSHTSGMAPRHPCLKVPFGSLFNCALAAASPLDHPPGTRFRYGNSSFQVAAAAAERATGQPWAEIFEERLAEPLGWSTTRYGVLPGETNPGVAGALLTTPEEFPRFLGMILAHGRFAGRQVLSPQGVAELEGPASGTVPTAGFVPGPLRGADRAIYGLGVWRHRVREGRATQVGAAGKFGFNAWVDRDLELGGMLAVQLSPEKLQQARRRPADIRAAVERAYADALPCPED